MTKEELTAILEGSEAGADLLKASTATLFDVLLSTIQAEQAAQEAALYDTLLAQLQQPVSEEATKRAREKAMVETDRLVTQMTQTQLNAIGETIAAGLEDGLGPDAIARRLQVVQGLDSNRIKQYDKYVAMLEESGLSDEEVQRRADRYFEKLLRERRQTIAATEARDATSAAREIEAKQAGKKWKRWLTVGDERVSDACNSNQGAGWIPIDESFPTGDGRPPQHPNCRCTLAYRKFSPPKS